ncbi:hypothetical protein AG0111_0g12354 [Alternaria gaisen]|uniref:Uncharacterized protein n=1 Tax=Alternaria gaisen TaxID=167740 RepID=A0ACB6F4S2_9PLEO|nr:hypothetical protein AG0111_0g12354 [Alternaria gaisen]
MQIPKQVSSLRDLNKPSFLNLSAEIRNRIYELLYMRDEPVLLHNAKAYHPIPPQDSHDPYRDDLIVAFDDEYENEIDQGQLFVHDFQTVTPALLVCRQVYAEAVGYLYSNNTFMFSRPLYRHDGRNGDDCVEHDDESYFVTNYVAQWLQNLGSQLKLLNEVRIDVGALCPDICTRGMEFFSILKLVRMLWRYPYLADVIAFSQREPTDREKNDFGMFKHPEEEHDMEHAERLQGILIAIGVQDVLNLKRYASMDLLVTNIEIESSLDYGYVTGPNLELKFETPEYEAVRWPEKSETPLSPLEDLNLPLMRKIFSLVTFPADQVILDLDLRKVYGFNPVMFQLNHRFRNMHFHWTPMDMSVLVRKSINTTTFDLSGFATPITSGMIDSTESQGIYAVFWRSLFGRFSCHQLTTIVLNFDIATATSLKEIRINIKDILPILFSLSSRVETKLRFVLKCPWGNATHYEEVTIPVVELVQSLFLLLSDVKQQWPSETSKTREKQLPDIWLSGNGVLISASYLANSHSSERRVEYTHGRLTPTEIRNRGYRMATATYTTYDLGKHRGTLGACWERIRYLHYHDRNWKRV